MPDGSSAGKQRSRARNRETRIPAPLNLVQKMQAIREWSHREHNLSASDISVFVAQVYRQNAKTGRCDPGIERLMEDTGCARSTVEHSLGKLRKQGAIAKNPRPGANKRKWIIYLLDAQLEPPKIKTQVEQNTHSETPRDPAEKPAEVCGNPPQDPADIKEKKKEKEKRTAIASRLGGVVQGNHALADRDKLRKEKSFEQKTKAAFECCGLGYEDLLKVPSKEFEAARDQWIEGEISIDDAIEVLLKAVGTAR